MLLPAWLDGNADLFLGLGFASFFLFVGTLALIPLIVIRIPVDYFNRKRRSPALKRHEHPFLGWFWLLFKNCLGGICVAAGLAMLVLPGQGLLTILVGVMLIDFPGKFALERRLVRHPRVFRSLNWIRFKAGKARLQPPL